MENIRKYQISLVGYLQEQEKRLARQAAEAAAEAELAKGYRAVEPKIAMN